jgi:hypothetical protein
MVALSQTQLVDDLSKILPEFVAVWAADNEEVEFRSGSLHSVYMSFLPLFSASALTQHQWRQVADLFSREVAAGGDRENAVDTCVLEHLHQVKLNRVLRPLLSPAAKALVRA